MLFCKVFEKYIEVKMSTLRKNDIPPESIVGFVTCLCDRNWCVLQIIQQVKLKFLHMHEASSSFKYPEIKDILSCINR